MFHRFPNVTTKEKAAYGIRHKRGAQLLTARRDVKIGAQSRSRHLHEGNATSPMPNSSEEPTVEPLEIQQVTGRDFVPQVWESPTPVVVIFYSETTRQAAWEVFGRMARYFEDCCKFLRCDWKENEHGIAYRYLKAKPGGGYALPALVIFSGRRIVHQPKLEGADPIDVVVEIERVLVSLGVKGANFFGSQQNTDQAQAKIEKVNSGQSSAAQASSPMQNPSSPQSQTLPGISYPVVPEGRISPSLNPPPPRR